MHLQNAMALSLNWKRLSGSIADSKASKVTLIAAKKIKKVRKAKKVKDKTKEILANAPIVKPITLSPLEYTLWVHENEIRQEDVVQTPTTLKSSILPNNARKKDTGKYLAMDCEFVGIGPEGKESALARVSIVNFYGFVIYDKFVKPREKVVDWRTWVSGITASHMAEAITFDQAQKDVAKLIGDRILVGHAVHHDLDSLFLSHPKSMTRDTSLYPPFRQIALGKTPSLKKLTLHYLKMDIQNSSHSSVEDARATMLLFRLYRKDFEAVLRKKLHIR